MTPLAQRLEDGLGDEQMCFIEGCPVTWAELPIPDGPMTVGIDGGYVKAQGAEQGWFEVIAGKSIVPFHRGEEPSNPSIKCFSFVRTYDEKPKRRLFEHLQSQGLSRTARVRLSKSTVPNVSVPIPRDVDGWFLLSNRSPHCTR
jgi:hypothetical protein